MASDQSEIGTAPAIIDIIESCDLALPSPAKPASWGGARNRSDRVSLHLSPANIMGLREAVAYAQSIGLGPNRHWTIHYERAGIAEADAARFIGHVLRLAGAYARRHNGKIAAMWVRENGEGKGGHVHILLHLSEGLTLRNRYRGWIEAAGGTYQRHVSKARSIGGRLGGKGGDDHWQAHYGANLGTVLAYVLKGAPADLGAALGLAVGADLRQVSRERDAMGGAIELKRKGEGGLIVGKRCGWTQNVGKAARRDGLQ